MKYIALASLVFATCLSPKAYSAANPVKGEELFKQCVACHNIGLDAEHSVGPTLNHIFGRVAGSSDGYANYSEGMQSKGREGSDPLIWEEDSLYIFLAGPANYIPGTTMGFAGFRKEQEIKDVLAYLISFSPAYEPESGKMVNITDAAAATLPIVNTNEEEDPAFTEAYLATEDAIALGGDLWANQCRHCHGNSAYPGKAPKLIPARYDPEFVFNRVTDGFRKMPAWKSVFTLDERKSIVAYVLSKKFSP